MSNFVRPSTQPPRCRACRFYWVASNTRGECLAATPWHVTNKGNRAIRRVVVKATDHCVAFVWKENA